MRLQQSSGCQHITILLHKVHSLICIHHPMISAIVPRKRIKRKGQQSKDVALVQVHIIRIQLHLIIMKDPLKSHPPGVINSHIREDCPTLQHPRFNLLNNSTLLPIRKGGGGWLKGGEGIHINIGVLFIHPLGSLGDINHSYRHSCSNQHNGETGVHTKPPVPMQWRLGVRIILNGSIDIIILSTCIHGHGHGKSIFRKAILLPLLISPHLGRHGFRLRYWSGHHVLPVEWFLIHYYYCTSVGVGNVLGLSGHHEATGTFSFFGAVAAARG
mmetsp:Transcript_14034/g.19934  ORF Transcript_14034/g.19934 Transcript_14034/m.19934 type:complete len:271 (+) Transcript_14034:1223-2035(+)